MAETDDWSANANDALAITLCQPSKAGPKPYQTFHPAFTYPIFGDEEQIFGYKNLKINLRYRANDMRPFVKVSYSKKFDAIGDTEPADIEGALKEFLPAVAFSSEADFVEGTKQLSPDWKPPGELHAEIRDDSGNYEIWRGSLADPAVKQTVARLDILASLFIEGGTPIIGKDDATATQTPDDDRWTVFFLYRKEKSADDPARDSYVFVGYSTIYRFYYYEKPTAPPPAVGSFELPTETADNGVSLMPSRSRLSQFVILPPFQNAGNGARLYATIFNYFHEQPQTRELTVEDPNEAFDDLRDLCDLAFLETLPEFRALKLNASYVIPKKGPLPPGLSDKEAVEVVRRRAKMAPRQFQRCVEMHMMLELPDSVRPRLASDDAPSDGKGKGRMAPPATKDDRKAYELWQLFVKTRLYVHNRDALGELDAGERAEKLQETLGGLELEYARLLARYRRRTQAQQTADKNGKRKLDAGGEAEEKSGGNSKRARVMDEDVEMRTTV